MMKKDELIKLMTSKEHIDKFRSIKPKSKPSKPDPKPSGGAAAPKPKKKKFIIKKKAEPKEDMKLSKNVREAPDKTYLYYDKRTKAQADAETIEGKETRFTSASFYRAIRTPKTLLKRTNNEYEKNLDELIDTYKKAIVKYAGSEDFTSYSQKKSSDPTKKEMKNMVDELKMFRKKKQEFIRTFEKRKKDVVLLEYKKEIKNKKVVYVLQTKVSVTPKYKELKMSADNLTDLNRKRDKPLTTLKGYSLNYSGNIVSQFLFKNKEDAINNPLV